MNLKIELNSDPDAKDIEVDGGVLTLHLKRCDCGYSVDIINADGEVLNEAAIWDEDLVIPDEEEDEEV